MEIISGFVAVLITGATLAAKGALSEVAKGTGKSIFEGVKARLLSKHNVKSLALLEDAGKNENFRNTIESELSEKDIVSDTELVELVAQLQDIIKSIPEQQIAKYAIDVEVIKSGSDVSFRNIAGGVRGKKINAEGSVAFTDVRSDHKGN